MVQAKTGQFGKLPPPWASWRPSQMAVSHYFACWLTKDLFTYRCSRSEPRFSLTVCRGLDQFRAGTGPASREGTSSKWFVGVIERSTVSEKERPEPSSPTAWLNYTDSHDFMERVRAGMPPLIICVACNGGIQGKEANEFIPETADEIAASVQAAHEAGAAMVHIHARNPRELTEGARETDTWREVLGKVR